MGLSFLMSAIYSIIITQITVSWNALDIIPHYDWQYFPHLAFSIHCVFVCSQAQSEV